MNRDPKADNRSLFSLIFESIMAILYVFLAYLLLATHVTDQWVGEAFRLPLGIVLGLYGLFRVFRAIKKLKSGKDEIQ